MRLSALAFASILSSAVAQTTVRLIHINDHHSNFDEASFELRGAAVPPGLSVDTEELRVYFGGAARQSALAKALRAEGEADGLDVCLLHAGDAITGTIFYTFFGPEPDALVMNTMGIDVFTVGNHEFDDGDANLANFTRLLDMPVLSYNLDPAEESELRNLSEEDSIKPYFLKDLSDGTQLGVCGITTKASTERSSQPDKGTTLRDEAESATACVAELEAIGVDKIVLLTHIGYDKDSTVMAAIPGVDVVIGGHSHTLLGGQELSDLGLSPQGMYAELVDGTCVVQGWEYSKVVGMLDIEFDENGGVVGCSGGPIMAINPDRFTVRDADPRFDLSDEDAAIATEYLTGFDVFRNDGEDQAIIDALAPFREQTDVVAQETIAVAAENICHTRGNSVAADCPDKEIQSQLGGGTCLLVAQGFLFNVPTADVAIQNSGGCREGIDEGEFTFGDAFSILPFSNTIVTFTMTGTQIKAVLEDAFNFFLDPAIDGGTGAFPAAAGLRWDVDYTAAFGDRVSNLEVNERLNSTWGAIDPTASYVVATNSFLAIPADGYFTFGEIDKENPDLFVNTFVEYGQSFVNFAQNEEVLVEPLLSEYSTQSAVFGEGVMFSIDNVETEEPSTTPITAPVDAPTGDSSPADAPVSAPVDSPADAPVSAPVDSPVDASSSSANVFNLLRASMLAGLLYLVAF